MSKKEESSRMVGDDEEAQAWLKAMRGESSDSKPAEGKPKDPDDGKSSRVDVRKENPKAVFKDTLGAKPLTLDKGKMYARAIITTNTVDRDWEIVVPSGCWPDSFEAGPASWFFNHQQFPFAVGTAKERPLEKDCPVDLEISDEFDACGCWFNQASKEAEILYALIDLGHMGNTSIGFNPIGETLMLSHEESDKYGAPQRVKVFPRWELLEPSWVGIGSNRGAMNEVLQRGYVGSLKVPETMLKMFEPFRLPKKALTNGYSPPTIDTITTPVSNGESKAMGTLNDTGGGTMADETEIRPSSHDLVQHMVKGSHALLEGAVPHLQKSDDGPLRQAAHKMCKSVWDGASELHKAAKGIHKGMEEMPELPEGMDFKGIPADEIDKPNETKDEPDKEKDESVDDDTRDDKDEAEVEVNIDADDDDDEEETDEEKSMREEVAKLLDERKTKQATLLELLAK